MNTNKHFPQSQFQQNNTLNLSKQEYTFKIHLPKEVNEKIKYICSIISNIEWSGVLFYNVEGTIENKDLKIIVVDVFPMDIGTASYTEFNMSPDVINYMAEQDLLDCYSGLIHSHHNMKTFFSGTDLATLSSEGKDNNHFVSLIVNNAGIYTAAITRNVKVIQNVVETSQYTSFEDVVVELGESKSYTKEVSKIEYYNLDIVKEDLVHGFETGIKSRLDELKTAKHKSVTTTKEFIPIASNKQLNNQPYTPPSNSVNAKSNVTFKASPNYERPFVPKQTEISFHEYMSNNTIEDLIDYSIELDKTKLKKLLQQLITGDVMNDSMIYNNDLALANTINYSMATKYDKRFSTMKQFTTWAEPIVDFIVWHSQDLFPTIEDEEELSALISYNLIEMLNEYNSNPYIVEYINLLKTRLI